MSGSENDKPLKRHIFSSQVIRQKQIYYNSRVQYVLVSTSIVQLIAWKGSQSSRPQG